MSQYVASQEKAFPAAGAIGQHLRVTINTSGEVAAAGLTVRDIGTLLREVFAQGDDATVRLATASGTVKVVLANAVTVGDPLFTASSGQVGDTAVGAHRFGVALESGGAGEVIEAVRDVHGETA